jgi:hypothetical protein
MRDDRQLDSDEIHDRIEELTIEAEPADDDRGWGMHHPEDEDE